MSAPSNRTDSSKALAKADPRDISIAGFTLHATGVNVTGKPALQEWRNAMQFVTRCTSASMWWHGDMLNFGYATYGELASQEEDDRYAYQTLRDAKWVAEAVPMSNRLDKLSWSHHREVAGLKPAEQKRWLVRAEKENMTRADLRKAIQDWEKKSAPPLPKGKFRVLYADPPWLYNDKCEPGCGAENHYQCMSIAELCAMPIKELCHENAVLFLWITSPLLFECAPVIVAWGFTYKASFCWDKIKHNLGHYNSVRHELLLICTKGSCLPDSEPDGEPVLIDSVQTIERTRHSVKPDKFYEIIERMYPSGPKLELFQRGKARKGWSNWGLEAEAAPTRR
jgi:N6-adenosine-specific RNA methylase IME4